MSRLNAPVEWWVVSFVTGRGLGKSFFSIFGNDSGGCFTRKSLEITNKQKKRKRSSLNVLNSPFLWIMAEPGPNSFSEPSPMQFPRAPVDKLLSDLLLFPC